MSYIQYRMVSVFAYTEFQKVRPNLEGPFQHRIPSLRAFQLLITYREKTCDTFGSTTNVELGLRWEVRGFSCKPIGSEAATSHLLGKGTHQSNTWYLGAFLRNDNQKGVGVRHRSLQIFLNFRETYPVLQKYSEPLQRKQRLCQV